MAKKILLLTLAALGLLALAALTGCGDDGPTQPANNTMTVDSGMAEEFTLEALDMVNELLSSVPDFADGSFDQFSVAGQPMVKTNSDSVAWDPAQQAWVYTFDGPLFEMDPPNHWDMSLDFWLQYRNGEGALQYPLGATQMQVRYGMGMDVHQSEGQESLDLDYEMGTDLTVSFLGQDTYGVAGSGAASVAMAQVSSEGSQSGTFAMDWTVDVATSAGGCASGTATVRTQAWTLLATYDGQGNVDWTLTGPNYEASGTDLLECGQPVN